MELLVKIVDEWALLGHPKQELYLNYNQEWVALGHAPAPSYAKGARPHPTIRVGQCIKPIFSYFIQLAKPHKSLKGLTLGLKELDRFELEGLGWISLDSFWTMDTFCLTLN